MEIALATETSSSTPAFFSAERVYTLISYALATALVLVAVWFARRDPAEATLPAPVPTAVAQPTTPANVTMPSASPNLLDPLDVGGDFGRVADIHTIIPTRPRYKVTTYTVEKLDTLFTIAKAYNLKPETILWGNVKLADNPNILSVGQVLNILPIDGALRIVQPGDTLAKIAKAFHGTEEEIVAYAGNDLDPNDPQIRDGQYIIIPGGWRESITWQLPTLSSGRKTAGKGWGAGEPGACAGPFSGPVGSYTFVYPTDDHSLSGTDFLPVGHPGLDFRAPFGVNIYASDSGVVVFAGWSTRGYGNLVIVDHGNGWQTAYAHLTRLAVGCGAGVGQGQVIGFSGSTGNSTGPHLHFEMRHNEYGRVNPWLYLP